MVHPDYWEDQTEAGGNNFDLALIKMNKVPVCLALSTTVTDYGCVPGYLRWGQL